LAARLNRLENFNEVRIICCDGCDTSSSIEKNRKLLRGVNGILDEAHNDTLKEETSLLPRRLLRSHRRFRPALRLARGFTGRSKLTVRARRRAA
jgi:hypothetical protein